MLEGRLKEETQAGDEEDQEYGRRNELWGSGGTWAGIYAFS